MTETISSPINVLALEEHQESYLRELAENAVKSLEQLEQEIVRLSPKQEVDRARDDSCILGHPWVPPQREGQNAYLTNRMIHALAYRIRRCLDPSLPDLPTQIKMTPTHPKIPIT